MGSPQLPQGPSSSHDPRQDPFSPGCLALLHDSGACHGPAMPKHGNYGCLHNIPTLGVKVIIWAFCWVGNVKE